MEIDHCRPHIKHCERAVIDVQADLQAIVSGFRWRLNGKIPAMGSVQEDVIIQPGIFWPDPDLSILLHSPFPAQPYCAACSSGEPDSISRIVCKEAEGEWL